MNKTTTTTTTTFDTISDELLVRPSGGVQCNISGLPSSAQEIIMAESGGRSHAKNPHSTAFGVGQLLIANRKKYMGSNYASQDCGLQIDAFRRYTMDRYGSYDKALAFRKIHGWY